MLKIAYHDCYAHPLPEGHRFPMEKYTLLPQQLLHEGTLEEDNFFEPHPAEDGILGLTHAEDYIEKLNKLQLDRKEIRRTGFPLSKELIAREKTIMQGTIMAAEYSLQHGIAMNIAGGTHHAYSNLGEGFCLLNDNAIAANYLLHTNKARRILIVDLDVHQGNGTAEIFQDSEKVFTFSMHGKNNFPLRKENSDLDIPLEDGMGDEEYLDILKYNLPKLINQHKPDFIFYQCGVDILASDKLGRLSLSIDGCKERDRFVLESCHEKGIPITCSMGGGYSEEIRVIIEAHANTYRLAQDIFF
ncbi:histone deacetylase family protein [Luteibaculum oceani]|uniref:Histone deacetylase n=1 Tax=Luteibaculum oceani TaxID=1294296 RepID=A0A5C6V4U4_9FLAO|nr:histone deacetylase [Luteibaculum oceani]TXC78555.1 histone deacetylase [Luteibaculum oceani]